jgi:hypothetical protein
MSAIDNFYLKQEEPIRGTFLALKDIILKQNPEITNELKYGMPFFSYKGKMFCYLWFHKKYQQPYIGFVEGKLFNEDYLLKESRSRMKIMQIDPNKDLSLRRIEKLLTKALHNH